MILESAGSKLEVKQDEVGRGPGVGRALRRSGVLRGCCWSWVAGGVVGGQ